MGIPITASHPHRRRASTTHGPHRRAAILALAIVALLPAAAWAQSFPNKPIRLLLPFAAGGAADLFGRSLASGLSTELGQQVVVETRPGAGGLTGVDAVAKSAPDGYTICLAGAAALSAIPFMVSKMPFDWQTDLALLTLVVRVPEVLTVHPSLGANTFGDFLTYARAHPGKINFGSAGAGSITHLAGELFKTEAKLDLVHVPYRGVGPAVTDMLGGHIQMIVADVPFLLPHVRIRRHQAARRDLRRAQRGVARCSDHRRTGLSRYQFRQLVRPGRARRHAGGDSRQAAQGERHGAALRGAEKAVRQPERRTLAHHAG